MYYDLRDQELTVKRCSVLNLPEVRDSRGNLAFIESGINIPFEIKRVYFLYDIPSNAVRGGHAHRKLEQLIVSLSGSFNIRLDDGQSEQNILLNNPSKGLLLQTGVWRELNSFSSGATALVLASTQYDSKEYIRDYDEFLAFSSELKSES